MSRLRGRAALVTGATGGIGRAIALALAREGATVVVTGRDTGRGKEVVDRIRRPGGRAEFVEADLSTGAGVALLARDAAAAAGGAVDILVNNAAQVLRAQSMLETTEEQIDRVLALNVRAPYLLTAALVPGMVERGGGSVVNVGSIAGCIGSPHAAVYHASKAGLHSLTRSWAGELAPKGVRVNAVVPGPIVTEMNTGMLAWIEEITARYPARRPGTAAEVADAVVFLASDQASYVHGALLPVDGGALA